MNESTRCCDIHIISDIESYCSSCSDAASGDESNEEPWVESYDEDRSNDKANNKDEEGCWIDVDDEVVEPEKASMPRYKMSDRVQAMHLLSDDSINKLLIGDFCVKGTKCMACPNDRDCADIFGPVKLARETIRNFRRKYWNEKSEPGDIFMRRKQLLQDIDAMKVHNNETTQIFIQYKIDGRFVCKSFFYLATGINIRMFNDVVEHVLQKRISKDMVKFLKRIEGKGDEDVHDEIFPKYMGKWCNIDGADSCLEFLDYYFTFCVEWSPHERNIRYLHMTFTELYKSFYVPYTNHYNVGTVTMDQFFRIRKSERRQYKRSKTIRKGGYNHVRCGECSRLQRLILLKKLHTAERDTLQSEFLAHVTKQQVYRDIYEAVIKKCTSVKHKKFTLSMIVDASGGNGATFYPRVKVVEKSDPQRYQLLKTKMTFAVVHGIGTLVYLSYPDLGSQGGNLTLEVVFRALREALQKKGVKHLKKLYIQFDNASNNKSWSVIITLAILIVCGVVDKIVIAFLLVGHTHTDVDRIISLVVSYLRNMDIPTLDKLKDYVLQSFNPKKENWNTTPPPTVFEEIMSMTDYELFSQASINKARESIKGITQVSMVKMTLAENGRDVHMIYKEDSDKKGWLPRPVLPIRTSAWSRYFKNDQTDFAPQRIVGNPLPLKTVRNVRGIPRRLAEWEYLVEHGDGNQFKYCIPVPSLPILPFPEDLLATIESAPAQPFQGSLLERAGQKTLKHRVKTILANRNMYTDENKNSWKMFFTRLPCDGDTLRPDEHKNVLAALIREYGRKIDDHPDFKPIPADLQDYGKVDPIQFDGGPIAKGEYMSYRRSLADGDKRCVKKRKKQSIESESSSDDNPTNKPERKKEPISRRKKVQASIEVHVDVPHDVMPASLEERLPTAVGLLEIKQERMSRRKKVQASIEVHADVPLVVNKKARVESLDGASPYREGSSANLEYYKGIHLMNMKSILEKMFGESSCGRVRLSLSLGLNDYSLKQSVFRDMCEALLQCSGEADFLDLLMLEGENAIKFMFFYAGRDNLSECIIGDGFCSLRNALALAMGFIPELPNGTERTVVKARDVDITNPDGLQEMLSFISDLISKLQGDNSFSSIGNDDIRESVLRKLRGMKEYLEKTLPAVLKANGRPFLHDTSLWLGPYAIPIISAYRAFNFTLFQTTRKFSPTNEMTTKGLRWWLAENAGDGKNPCRFHSLFTYRECSDVITKEARFCTTGVGRETQPNKKGGSILCHFYPIPTHNGDMSDALDEAVASLAKSLHNNSDLMRIRSQYLAAIAPPVEQVSELERLRQENIARNNDFLSSLGIFSAKPPAALTTEDVSTRRPRRPAPEQTRRSTRVSSKATVSADDAAQASVKPGPGESKTTVSRKEVPKPRELKLLHAVFADDEDPSKQFYVTDVKYYAPFKTVCCFCVPYHGDVEAAKLLAVNLHNSSNADDYIYDCTFVKNNVVSYELSLI